MSDMAASVENPHVLIADDDPTIVLLIEHVLEGLGRTYDTADTGTAAWDAWQKTRHLLVVLDIEMPGMDGLEVCRRIRASDTKKETFILVVTGRDRAADLEAVLDAGANDYVTKPTSGQRLTARLRIAQRRMADDYARRAAEAEVSKTRWLAGIGEATVALQHEINNPLTSLLGTAELLLLEAQEKKQPTDEIRLIIEQGRRISGLVKRLGELRDPKSVEYARGDKMIDLGDEK
jgi:DNA-binding response OmpR family regulator